MMDIRQKVKSYSERFHGEIHLLFGLAVLGIILTMFPKENILTLSVVMVLGSFLPDIDHLFFMFVYGRKTEYATSARKYLLRGDVSGFVNYCKKNHKSNTNIISHNLVVPVVFFLFGLLAVKNEFALWGMFWWSMSAHFVFDVFEDLLFFGKLNGNWYLRYGKRA